MAYVFPCKFKINLRYTSPSSKGDQDEKLFSPFTFSDVFYDQVLLFHYCNLKSIGPIYRKCFKASKY